MMKIGCGWLLFMCLFVPRAWTADMWDLPARADTAESKLKWEEMNNYLSEMSKESKRNANCENFTQIPNSLTLKGQIMRKVPEAKSEEACKKACLDVIDFDCSAFIMKKPDTCYVIGFHMRIDYYSTHYTRVCAHGPKCFVPKEGYTAGFVDSLPIPEPFVSYPELRSYYCMAHAELKKSAVGFDLKTCRDNKCAECSFTDFTAIHDYSFDLYVRRC